MVNFIPFIVLVLFGSSWAAEIPKSCKCIPSDPCWPPVSAWSSLNYTLSGRLIRGVPPASVCYPGRPEFDSRACDYVSSQWTNSSFHAADPVSIDFPVWSDNSCNPVYPNGTSIMGEIRPGGNDCNLGNYPVYVVNATTPSDVQSAFKFAKRWNIRLVIKSTGHSLVGRSTGYGSLSIWTHHMRGIKFHTNFRAKSCVSDNKTEHLAATIAAGEQSNSIYKSMAAYDAVVVGGSNPDVGMVGWFTGGGHGPLSSTYGMGSDNLLQAVVVTPSGDMITTNACLYPDLFYAIRGGGGGTYGVIVEATMKAYPNPFTTFYVLDIILIDATQTNPWWKLMAYIHSELPRLKAGGLQGYYGIFGPPVSPSLSFSSGFYLYEQPEGTVEKLFAPITDYLLKVNGTFIVFHENVRSSASFFDLYTSRLYPEKVATGGGVQGSRLLTPRALTEDLEELAKILEEIGPKPNISNTDLEGGAYLLGNFAANNGNKNLDTGLNPAWRKATTHLMVIKGYSDIISPGKVKEVYKDMTNNKVFALRQLDPDSGTYFNEPDPFEPDWQWAFFGGNYLRLSKTKRKYDPDGLLWCLGCVGSEEWTEDPDRRLCRLPWSI